MDRYPTQAELDAAERIFRKEGRGGMTAKDTMSPHARTVHLLNDAECRLAAIAWIIEAVDERCAAVDGPVTPTLEEMTQAEISEIYRLAKNRPDLSKGPA